MSKKYYVTNFRIEHFINPVFDTYEEAHNWVNKYIDRIADEDEARGINWAAVDWNIEESEEDE